MDLQSMVRAHFVAKRDGAFLSARVTVAFGMQTFQGIRTAVDGTQAAAAMNQTDGAAGAVRLNCGDMDIPHPKPGDEIEVTEPSDTAAKKRSVLSMRYDQVGACVLMTYGERYG
jgi:hypothetical protein